MTSNDSKLKIRSFRFTDSVVICLLYFKLNLLPGTLFDGHKQFHVHRGIYDLAIHIIDRHHSMKSQCLQIKTKRVL